MMVGDWLKRLRRTHASTAHTTGVTGSGVDGAGARNGLSRLVTTVLRNPTTPVTGVASCAVGAGVMAAAAADVVSVVLAADGSSVFAASVTVDSETVAEV